MSIILFCRSETTLMRQLIKVLRPSSHPTQNRSFQRRSSQPISWLSTEKPKQTEQKQTCIHNKIYYNIKLTPKN